MPHAGIHKEGLVLTACLFALVLLLLVALAPAHAQTLLLTLNTPNPQAGACFG